MQIVQLKTGVDGKAKAQLKAGGVNVPIPPPVSGSKYLTQDTAVTAQLTSSNGLCLTTEFVPSGTKKNDGVQFMAKATS